MRVLVACEFSQIVTQAFRAVGCEAYSCDTEPTEGWRDWHFRCDVRRVLDKGWDLLIAHPPCTYLTNAGVRHLHSVPSRNGVLAEIHGYERVYELQDAAEFFTMLLDYTAIPRRCIENPVPHRYATALVGPYSQTIQPWQFGHGETKATCLWLRGLPPLTPTHEVIGRETRVHSMSPGPNRAKERSRFYHGIAAAMATQWGVLSEVRDSA